MTSLEEISAVLLDLDDNIRPVSARVFPLYQDFARVKGLSIPSDKDIQTLWGNPLAKMLSGLWPNNDGLEKEWINFVPGDFNDIEAFPGVIEALDVLGEKYPLGVISSTPKRGVVGFAKRNPNLKIDDRFFHFQTGEDCVYHKPDGRVFDAVLNKLGMMGITPGEVLYVGDHLVDAIAAQSRGLLFIATLTGFTKRDEFYGLDINDEMILSNLAQLPNRLAI